MFIKWVSDGQELNGGWAIRWVPPHAAHLCSSMKTYSSTECNIPRILCVMMLFYPTFYNGCNYLSMLGCNLTILEKGSQSAESVLMGFRHYVLAYLATKLKLISSMKVKLRLPFSSGIRCNVEIDSPTNIYLIEASSLLNWQMIYLSSQRLLHK